MEKSAAYRAQALLARRAMTDAQRTSAGEQICERLMALPEVREAGVIFSYLAAPEEADLSPLHEFLAKKGCTLAFPVTGPYGEMEAYAPHRPWRFVPGLFGIRSPVPEDAERIMPEAISVILTPCVAFDGACRRLGHGKGYYDRYFPRCPRAVRIGIAFEAQRLPQIESAPWDVPMHAFVTERRIYRPG